MERPTKKGCVRSEKIRKEDKKGIKCLLITMNKNH